LLLVEDEETNREFAIYALNQYFDIDLALDGKSALSLVEKKQYEIILLDVNLGKEMTGIDVVKILRKMPSYSKIPIAAVTANALKTQRDAFLKSGFSHYLAKPYTRRELQALVRNMLSGNAFGQDL
jgi:CheY-like chemotaxis protein